MSGVQGLAVAESPQACKCDTWACTSNCCNVFGHVIKICNLSCQLPTGKVKGEPCRPRKPWLCEVLMVVHNFLNHGNQKCSH